MTKFLYINERELSLYIVKPKDWKKEDSRPAAVFFHGGGWVRGKPTQFNYHSRYLASRGMVCIQVQYRLMTKNDRNPLSCVHDARSAMRWVRSRAAELGIDPNRIASGGGSAGGHLAAHIGMVEGLDDPKDDLSVAVKSNAMLLFNPVLDNGPNGYGYKKLGKEYLKYSPFHNITKDDPPSIFFLGNKDKLIPVKMAEDYKAKMDALKILCDVVVFKDMPHSFFNYSKYEHVPYYHTILEMDRFLKKLGWLDGEPTLKVPADTLGKVQTYFIQEN